MSVQSNNLVNQIVEEFDGGRGVFDTVHSLMKSSIHSKAVSVYKMLKSSVEDAESLVTLSLLKALDGWSNARNNECKFTTFFWNRVNLDVADAYAKVRTTPNNWGRRSSEPEIVLMTDLTPHYSSGVFDEENEEDIEAIIYNDPKIYLEEDKLHYRDVVLKLLKVASIEEKRTIKALYKGLFKNKHNIECSHSSVARNLKVSPMCVKNRLVSVANKYYKTHGKNWR